jgi:hypothetical protein
MTRRQQIGVSWRGILTQGHHFLLLVAWESYVAPSRTVTSFYIAAQIRVKLAWYRFCIK